MSDAVIDSIILGDNQFFGVNHMSQDRGKETYEKFKDVAEIRKTLYYALDNGVKGVMFSTHPAIYQITDMMRADPVLKKELGVYVNVPYIVKYVSMVTEMGVYRTVKTMLQGQTIPQRMKYVATSGYNVLTRDFLGITHRLIDVELIPFRGLAMKAVFLHNCLCDLILGYDMAMIIESYDGYIRKKYGTIPAYGTLNYPLFCRLLAKAGIDNAVVMASVNKKGFLMNPSREACEVAMKNHNHTVLAMATLASGSIRPQEAYEYIRALGTVRHVVVGLSSQGHAEETFRILHATLNV
jgi:hypothetical protein